MFSTLPQRLLHSALLTSALVGGSIELASAQSNPRLVGITQFAPFVETQDVSTCASTICSPPLPAPATVSPFAGGTAHDATDRGTFLSDGLNITKVDARTTGCIPKCPTMPFPNTSPNNPVTGLAYNESTSTLFATDQSGIIRWYSVAGGCQLSLISRCIAPIPTGAILTGCATDDLNGLIFWSAVIPGTPGGRVYVAPQTAPCSPICVFPVNTCGTIPMNLLQGVAYDSCTKTVYVTDGRLTVGLTFDPILCGITGQTGCCINTIDPYVGLCILPAAETSSGPSCSGGTCTTCPTMTHTLGADPTIGNPAFSLELKNAPSASFATLLLNAGPALPSPGLLSPPFCSGILVPFVPLSVGPFVTPGPAGSCLGNITLNVPIPPSPLFCGQTFSTQWIGFCGGFSGTFVTNCLTWTIGAS